MIALLLTPYLQIWLDESWRWTLTIYGAIFVVVTLIWAVIGKERRTEEPKAVPALQERGSSGDTSLWSVLKEKDIWVVGVGMAGMLVMEFSILTLWPTLMLRERGIEETVSGAMLLTGRFARYRQRGFVGDVDGTDIEGDAPSNSDDTGIALVGTAIGMNASTAVPLLWTFAALHGVGFSFVSLIWTVPFEIPGVTHRQIAVASGFIEGVGRLGGCNGPRVCRNSVGRDGRSGMADGDKLFLWTYNGRRGAHAVQRQT